MEKFSNFAQLLEKYCIIFLMGIAERYGRGMSKRSKKHYDKSVYRSFALITQFGINMLVPICMMTALGIYLDEKLETSFLMVILFFVGAIAGGQNVFRLAKRIYGSSEKNSRDAVSKRDSK